MDYNHITLVGRLTRDPDLKYTEEGAAFCRFRMAVNPRLRGVRESTKALFIEVLVWKKNAEACREHLAKGQTVLVAGSLQIREWTDDEDRKQGMLQVFADRVEFGQKSKVTRAEKVDQETGEVF